MGTEIKKQGLASLSELVSEFEKFRSSCRPGSRIPSHLRAAAIDALGRGVTRTQLRDSCGVSASQLRSWQSSPGAAASATAAVSTTAHVVEVVDDEADRGQGESVDVAFRFGSLELSVRLRPAARA